MPITEKDTINELKKISNQLTKLNANDATIKDITKREFALNKKDSVRSFKESLKKDIKSDTVDKLVNQIKPAKDPLTNKGILDVFGEIFKFSAVDELEPIGKSQLIVQGKIMESTIDSSLWLRDIFFLTADIHANIDKLTDRLTGFATFAFSQKRREDENQRIQEERNMLIEEQTEKLSALLDVKPAVKEAGEKKKGLFGKMFDGLGENIGGAVESIFKFFALGSLIKFFAKLPIVKGIIKTFSGTGGILGSIMSGILTAVGSVFAFVGGYNIGKKIGDFIDEKMGLGKGGIGIWLFDAIHSEEGLIANLWRVFGNMATAVKDGIVGLFTNLPAIWDSIKESLGPIGQQIEDFLVNNFGDFFEPIITDMKEFYTFFEPDLIRFKDSVLGFFTNLVDGIIEVKDNIVNKLIAVKEQISGFVSDPIGFVRNLLSDDKLGSKERSALEGMFARKFGKGAAKTASDEQLQNFFEMERNAEKLLQRNKSSENFSAVRQRRITESAKREALRAETGTSGTTGKTVNTSIVQSNTSVVTPTDMGTDMNENTFNQLQVAN